MDGRAIKRNEGSTDMCYDTGLRNSMVSKRSQLNRPYRISFTVYKMSKISKSVETKSELMVTRGWKEGRMEVTAHRYKASFDMMATFKI